MGHVEHHIVRVLSVRVSLLLAMLLSVPACKPHLRLTAHSEVPVPTITKIPLVVGVYYDDKLRNYVYEEHSKDRPDWYIATGASQLAMFEQVLPSMFRSVRPVDSTAPTVPGAIDAVISPGVDTIQFAVPSETKTHQYEVWVKYQIRLFQPDGTLVAGWPVAGHGRCMDGAVRGQDEGINTAITLALRDAGAKLALGFMQVPQIRTWMAGIGRLPAPQAADRQRADVRAP